MRKREKCTTCIYRTGENLFCGEYSMKCDYLKITGKRRPCEPGEECTVYERGKRRRKNDNKDRVI